MRTKANAPLFHLEPFLDKLRQRALSVGCWVVRSEEDEMTTSGNSRCVEIWPIDRPKPNPRNARVHSEAQIAELAASLQEFGWTRPLLVDETEVLLAGHGVLLAARRLGLREVAVVVIDHLSERQKLAYVIADNQLALNSSWDEEKLRQELDALEKEPFDLMKLGFSPQELD